MKFKLLPVAATVAILLQPTLVEAEWSSDPSVFHQLDSNGTTSHTLVDSQGNLITGYSDKSNNYDFYLEKTGRDGEPLWNGERKLVVDRSQIFNVRWSMVLDPEDAIYTGVEDLANRYSVISKTNPDGTPAWDAPYIPEAESVMQGLTIELAHTPAGLAYTYTYDKFDRTSELQIGMVDDATGELKWKQLFTVPSGGPASIQDIEATEEGVVVLARAPREGDSQPTLYMQKFDYEGNPVWGEAPLALTPYLPYSSGNVVRLNSDGDGGIVVAWKQHDANNNPNIHLQHIKADGEFAFNDGGLRISHGSTLQYSEVNMPTVVVSAEEIAVSWAARSPHQLPTFTLFTQRVSWDGELLLGSEPKSLYSVGATETSWEYVDGGQLMRYGDNYSMLYLKSDDAGGNSTHIKRIDFTPEGEILKNDFFAEEGTRISYVSPVRSIYGETIATFSTSTGFDEIYTLNAQSMTVDGDIGFKGGINIEYPEKPWIIAEGGSLETELRFLDSSSSTHNVNISSSDSTVSAEVSTINDGLFSISVAPDADFSGIVPFTVEVADATDPNRTETLSYNIRVKPVNDAPVVNVEALMTADEGDAVLVEPEINDPDSESLSVNWTQTAGQDVDFDPSAENLSFDAPIVTADDSLEFLLSVSDEDSTTEKTVTVNVADKGQPTLSISSVSLQEGQSTGIAPQLSGAKEPLSVEWSQVDGPDLTLSSTSELSIQVTAPFVDDDSSATLNLAITDANGESVEQTVTVNITNKSSGKSGGGSSNWLVLCLLAAAAFIKRSVKA